LTEIAKKDENEYVRRVAVAQLTDQNILAEIAKKDKGEHVRAVAINGLTDPNVIADIVKKEISEEVREFAIKKITKLSGGISIMSGSSLKDALMGQAAYCLKCGTVITFKEGATLAMNRGYSNKVMCKKCNSVFSVILTPSSMTLS
jgi:hypothetical protein